jgi:hypothetical protein
MKAAYIDLEEQKTRRSRRAVDQSEINSHSRFGHSIALMKAAAA